MQLNEGLEVLGTDDHPDGQNWCGVFQGSAVEGVLLPSTLKRIEYSAFENCKSLKRIALPAGLECVATKCFWESVLKSISFPPSVKVIEKDSFYQCKCLRTVTFAEGLERIGSYAFFASGLESVELPASLRVISQGAFAKCEHLRAVKFGDGLETLGTDDYPEDGGTWYGVFQESSVERVELPRTLKRIEYNAFKAC